MEQKTEEGAAKFILPDGFSREDIGQGDYAQPMLQVCAKMSEENEHLCERAAARGFDPSRELDYTDNDCGFTIDSFFEVGAYYEEGRVPQGGFKKLLKTFQRLMEALEARANAPKAALDAASVAFREALMPLRRPCDSPEKPRRVYLKTLFRGRDTFKEKLRLLHAAYVQQRIEKPSSAPRKPKAHKRRLTRDEVLKRDDRKRVLTEIARLCRLGKSAPKAIRQMRAIGTWSARMRGAKDATWLRYYRSHSRTV